MNRFAELRENLSRKMENYAKAEGVRLRASNHGKLRLIGISIGVVLVLLLAAWLAHHP